MNHTYAVVIEPAGTGFSAYVPDLPGCVAAASSREAVLVEIRAAIQFHLEGMEMVSAQGRTLSNAP
jgi:predicted RNase H-like HicB family nuclease